MTRFTLDDYPEDLADAILDELGETAERRYAGGRYTLRIHSERPYQGGRTACWRVLSYHPTLRSARRAQHRFAAHSQARTTVFYSNRRMPDEL